ncbi:DUF4355 domain-containing protein [Paenibacillus sp. ACRRX]|uniref:DUF4355 domain-containing protein n=1 Tax=Paenibacillus sp. ACRRX TaxID=2918206 RepID=UPI001EF67880|nr:DUF4355 domain-containing protein [Paenibacillus sp. ACRRX]MCG7406773.1 DUF4355 domain-containing protein [Paenibacillus sp. ACRRX]
MLKTNRYRFPLNIQLFADGEGTGEGAALGTTEGAGQDGGQAGQGGKEPDGDKSFTQADVDRIIQDRLGKAQSKWEKEYQAKLDEAKTEAEKLAKMNTDQKAEYDRQKREDELATREAEITKRELRATALESLADKGLPKQLADILVYSDADSTNKSLEAVETAFRAAVESGVNERLKGDPPKGGGSSQQPKGYEAGKSVAEQRNQKGSGK